ncbi:hypothetical protein [Paenibacillus sp. FSL W7-1287]|uniref:hypothetical protein n=1 Tax=Paenibacillus sp. FSL W7-1287 TaxID=2954538 RepID=UPI0030F6529F
MSNRVFASAPYSTPNPLQRICIVIKVVLFNLPLSIRVKKLGFQDQEAWTILENEERSVQ